MLGCSVPTTPVTFAPVTRRRSLACCSASKPIGPSWTNFVARSGDWRHCLGRSARSPPGNACWLSSLLNADRRLRVGAPEHPSGFGPIRAQHLVLGHSGG